MHTNAHIHFAYRMGVFEFGVLQMDEQQMNVIVQFYDAFHMDGGVYFYLCAKFVAYSLLILMIHFTFFFGELKYDKHPMNDRISTDMHAMRLC